MLRPDRRSSRLTSVRVAWLFSMILVYSYLTHVLVYPFCAGGGQLHLRFFYLRRACLLQSCLALLRDLYSRWARKPFANPRLWVVSAVEHSRDMQALLQGQQPLSEGRKGEEDASYISSGNDFYRSCIFSSHFGRRPFVSMRIWSYMVVSSTSCTHCVNVWSA